MCNIRKDKRIAIVNRKCQRRIIKNLGASIVFTDCPGHATKIVKDSYDYDVIIAVGGDGTISEIVNGMDLEKQTLAIIPTGSGNSLARDLGITSPAKAVGIIKKNIISKIDLIDCEFKTKDEIFKRYAVATSGIGFASATAFFANRYLKSAGAFCYPVSACFCLFNQKVISAKIKIDDSAAVEIEFTNFIINNTKHAGNLCVFPQADFRDSELNLLYAKRNALTQYLWNVGIITRTYFFNSGTEKAARSLNILLNGSSTFMLDGEIFNSVKEVTYSVLPQRLRLLN